MPGVRAGIVVLGGTGFDELDLPVRQGTGGHPRRLARRAERDVLGVGGDDGLAAEQRRVRCGEPRSIGSRRR